MEPSLVITGLGLSTCLGAGVSQNWRALCAGGSGLGPVRIFDVSSSTVKDGGKVAGTGESAAGSARDGRDRALDHLTRAIDEALRHAGLMLGESGAPQPERIALVLGSSLAASASSTRFWTDYIEQGPGRADYASLQSYDVEPMLAEVCRRCDVRGGAVLVSNACAAGASSLCVAADTLRLGRADVVIAGGFDTLELHTFAGFHALGALSPGPLKPFGSDRAGMKLSDSFGVMIVEREDDVRRRRRPALCRFLGYGESADAHNLTQPQPEGTGAALAMTRALRMARLEPDRIDLVNVHATATPSNDLAEYRAMATVFGNRIATLPLHAAKPSIGHGLGGAGAVEAVFTILSIVHQTIPPTLGIGTLDPEIPELSLSRKARESTLRYAMSNSFGFGGCNASLVFGAPGGDEAGAS